MKRGDVVVCVMSSDLGKIRPAVVVQADLFNDILETTTVCPLTTTCIDAPLFRVAIYPTETNRIRHGSQVMVDKVCSIRNTRIREVVGYCSDEEMEQLDAALQRWLGLDKASQGR